MNILITGANRGLGIELVKEGLKRGHTIIATYRSPGEDLPRLKEEYQEKLVMQVMDVEDLNSISSSYDSLSEKFDYIDCIVNNAAVLFETKAFKGDPIVDMDIDMFHKTLEINVHGIVKVMKKFMPLIYKGSDRCIVNITSEGAKLKSEGSHYIAYSVSKIALNSYTQKIRNYLAAREDTRDIRVYMIHPGRMFTIMGVENAQIQPSEPAFGIFDIIERKVKADFDIPFINYKGEQMPT